MTMNEYSFGRVADLSTGHLALSVRAALDRVDPSKSSILLARTGFGYMMRPLKDREAPSDLPLETVLVLDHATLQGFDLVHFDRDGSRDPSLPWFEDGDVLLDAASRAPLVKYMGEYLLGMGMQQADPQKAVLFNMAILTLRKLEIEGHEPDREILVELRNSAAEFTYGEAPEDRFGRAIGSLQSWRPDPGPGLEL